MLDELYRYQAWAENNAANNHNMYMNLGGVNTVTSASIGTTATVWAQIDLHLLFTAFEHCA